MSYPTLLYSTPSPGVALITFNRPQIKNAMDEDAMYDWGQAIKQANADPSVNVIVVTGCLESGVFTAGARLSGDFGKAVGGSSKGVGNTTEWMINCHIDSEKPLIAACNGAAIGVGTTILGLYDFVYCTPNTVFRVPFMPLAVGAEGLSSLTFATTMGPGLANQLLFLDRTFPATKFVQCGFVTDVYPKEGFLENVMKVAKELAGMPPLAVRGTRDLVIQHRYGGRERLRAINKIELENLANMVKAPENVEARNRYISSILNKPKPSKM